MEFFKWQDSFNIGIEEIDRQHREFMTLLNDYLEVLSHVKQATAGPELFGKINAYIAMHCDYEIALLKSMGYRNIKKHQAQHEYFQKRIQDLENEQQQGNEQSLSDLLIFLQDWFLKHIQELDREYVPYVKQGHK
jgi:hemerythrin